MGEATILHLATLKQNGIQSSIHDSVRPSKRGVCMATRHLREIQIHNPFVAGTTYQSAAWSKAGSLGLDGVVSVCLTVDGIFCTT